jgi:F-type H+-transporting ATPase subunit beta
MRRPALYRPAFQPMKRSFAPALSTRFASTDAAKDGKIHQVIGAIVDVRGQSDAAAKNFSRG